MGLRLRSYIAGSNIDAESCYWGHSDGPHDPSATDFYNVNASGSYVTDGADYQPFDDTVNIW